MNRQLYKGIFMLLLTAMIWGTAFVAQSVGMQAVEGFTFSSLRTLLGALVLLPVVLLRRRAAGKGPGPDRAAFQKALRAGALLGLVFCAATNTQQFAFNDASPGKIAFITALYIFFVPLLGLLFKKKVPPFTWPCVALALVGLYLLSVPPGDFGGINKGEFLSLLSALFFALHIVLVDRFAADADGITLSCVQFAVSGLLSTVLMLLFESPSLPAIRQAAVPILYAGAVSCGLAYTFQILGQRYVRAAFASLLLCMESVFAVLASAILLHETMTGRETAGCVLMFLAIFLSQLYEALESRKRPEAPRP